MGSSNGKPKYFPALVRSLPSQSGRVVVITGTTSGTGFALAKLIAEKGGRVLCLNRPSERATKAVQGIQASVPDADVTQVDCDLKSFDSVRAAAQEVIKLCPDGIDALVNNAGIMAMPDEASEGFDVQMQVNHLSHFLLTKELLPLLELAAERTGEARVVNHSSIARKQPKAKLSRKYLEKNGGSLGGGSARWKRYQQTKLANLVFTYALADRLAAKGSKVKSTCAHPGVAKTSLFDTSAASGTQMGGALGSWVIGKFMQHQEDGACGITRCAAGDVQSAGFYGPAGFGFSGRAGLLPRKKQALADNQASKDLLWECSEAAVGPFAV